MDCRPKHIYVLLIEDNPGDAFLIQDQLKRTDAGEFNLSRVEDLSSAISKIELDYFDIILLDLVLPDSQGIETFLKIQEANPHIPIILLTGMEDQDLATEAVHQGAQDYLIKGQTSGELLDRAIHYAIERKQNQEQLEQHILELEGFSYMVSHDLRNPLTSIITTSWLLEDQLEEQYTETLSEEAKKAIQAENQAYVQNILTSCSRMKELIESLLILSQVQYSELEIQLVDISNIVQQIACQLQQQEPERQVEFIIAPQVMAQGDPRLLKLALENLLNNSWKYTGKKVQSLIEFGTVSLATQNAKLKHSQRSSSIIDQAQLTRNQLVYFVRDNGVGFDGQQAAKLFTPFQRLHDRSQFPGTGIGLATVQRIIQQHGGQIWFDAAINRGATFYFVLGQD